MQKSVPAICTDIDGVLYRGDTNIEGSRDTVRKILTPLESGEKLPFVCLTNGGGFTEKRKAEDINKKMDLKEEKLTEEEVIQCHTVFADQDLLKEYAD